VGVAEEDGLVEAEGGDGFPYDVGQPGEADVVL